MSQQIQTAVGPHRRGQERQTRPAPAPAWLDPSKLARALVSAKNDQVAPVEAEHHAFPEFEVYATNRGEHDLVLQFLEVKIPAFEDFLENAVEVHFGSTEVFALHHDPTVQTYGLLMRNVRANPAFSQQFYVADFLDLMVRAARIDTIGQE